MAALSSQLPILLMLAVVASGLFCLHELLRVITRPTALRFSEILSISILLGYGIGTVIYLMQSQTEIATGLQHGGLYFNQRSLGLAFAAVLFSSAFLYLTSAWETPKRDLAAIAELSTPKAERLVWLGLALVLIALYSGQIAYMGTVTSTSGRISALGALATLVTPPLVPYTLALATGERPFVKRLVLWGTAALLVSVTLVLGRRFLLYILVLSAMVFFVRPYRLSLRRLGWTALLGGIAAILLYFGFNFFMALRLSVWHLGEDAGLWAQISAALSILGGEQSTEVGEILAENLETRTFILSYFAGLVGISSGSVPTLGRELLYSIQMAVPSLLMPGKTTDLPPAPEDLIHPLYGISVFDGPNTIVVAGYDDFGFIGAALYPVGLAILYAGYYFGVSRIIRSKPIRVLVLFALIFQLLYIEQSLTGNLVVLRDLTILVTLFWMLMHAPAVRFSSPVRWRAGRKHAWSDVSRSALPVPTRGDQ